MSTPFYSLENILAALKIKSLNAMQEASIAANREHENLILLSATGSGKTLAFLLPILNQVDPQAKGTQVLIIAPSRELALQIEDVTKKMGTGLKITACYGGHKREIEENNLLEAPTIIVGTPGRLGDHIRRANIHTETIHTLVLDEFDKSVEFGFEEEMSFVVGSLPSLKKRILVSATEALELPRFLKMSNPHTLNFLTGEPSEALALKLVKAPDADKLATLFRLICALGNRSTIVFLNHRDAVQRTSEYLRENGLMNVFYHGALEQPERDAALCKFRNGTSNILVTTDLAARGLDIPNIRYIIHYHLPLSEESFIHRNGRTARMEASGTALLLIGPGESVPEYIDPATAWMEVPDKVDVPEKPQWVTLHIAGGKKNKINKIDIVGFLTQKGELKKEDIGLIEVKDFFSFVAIRKSKMSRTLPLIEKQKIKGQRVKIEIAK
ncbi:DEAD/DEAH box helicase [Flavihumibacter sp. CACIAM 22H1]|uniref:DEAD/DEAH box helicase n=1 Tax=Flavihumibacter sp. CACIAM 22H1 TaxID=1812911 RepID=UPI0007A86FD7|nr:DEAD/DEAH box helicase [Flavihumibacter sp. CACIAM 22H1]KYP13309.1 MAG: helicase [Flavihumibacter sp. CACIAM 22H1]